MSTPYGQMATLDPAQMETVTSILKNAQIYKVQMPSETMIVIVLEPNAAKQLNQIINNLNNLVNLDYANAFGKHPDGAVLGMKHGAPKDSVINQGEQVANLQLMMNWMQRNIDTFRLPKEVTDRSGNIPVNGVYDKKMQTAVSNLNSFLEDQCKSQATNCKADAGEFDATHRAMLGAYLIELQEKKSLEDNDDKFIGTAPTASGVAVQRVEAQMVQQSEIVAKEKEEKIAIATEAGKLTEDQIVAVDPPKEVKRAELEKKEIVKKLREAGIPESKIEAIVAEATLVAKGHAKDNKKLTEMIRSATVVKVNVPKGGSHFGLFGRQIPLIEKKAAYKLRLTLLGLFKGFNSGPGKVIKDILKKILG